MKGCNGSGFRVLMFEVRAFRLEVGIQSVALGF